MEEEESSESSEAEVAEAEAEEAEETFGATVTIEEDGGHVHIWSESDPTKELRFITPVDSSLYITAEWMKKDEVWKKVDGNILELEQRLSRYLKASVAEKDPFARLGVPTHLLQYYSTQHLVEIIISRLWTTFMVPALADMRNHFVYRAGLEAHARYTENNIFLVFEYVLRRTYQSMVDFAAPPWGNHWMMFSAEFERRMLQAAEYERLHQRMIQLRSEGGRETKKQKTEREASRKNRMTDTEWGMVRLSQYMTNHQYCVIRGVVFRYVENTWCGAVKPEVDYADVLDAKSGSLMTAEKWLWKHLPRMPDLNQAALRSPILVSHLAQRLEKDTSREYFDAPEKHWVFFAFRNCILQVAEAPRHAKDGEYKPFAHILRHGDLPAHVVAPRFLDFDFDAALLTTPLGFYALNASAAPKVVAVERGDGIHAEFHLAKEDQRVETFARAFRLLDVEAMSDADLVRWVTGTETFFCSDVWYALRDLPEAELERVRSEYPLWTSTVLMQVMSMQRYSDQQMFLTYVMLGRILYPSRTMENWQCFLLFLGESRSGKGVLLMVAELILGFENVTQIKNDHADLFAQAIVREARACVFPDLRSFKGFTCEEMLKAAANEPIVQRLMRTEPEQVYWRTHLMLASNNLTILHDEQGKHALPKRGVVNHHKYTIPDGDQRNLGEDLAQEVPQVFTCMVRCNLRYVRALRGCNTTLMACLPRSCVEATLMTEMQQLLIRFSQDERWIVRGRAEDRVSVTEFRAAFEAWRAQTPGLAEELRTRHPQLTEAKFLESLRGRHMELDGEYFLRMRLRQEPQNNL